MLSHTFPPGAGTGTAKQRSLNPWETHGWQVERVLENSLYIPFGSYLHTRHLVRPRSKIRRGGWDRLFWGLSFIYLFPANSQLLKGKEIQRIGSVLISLGISPPSLLFLLCPCRFIALSLMSLLLEMSTSVKTAEKIAQCPVKLPCKNVKKKKKMPLKLLRRNALNSF